MRRRDRGAEGLRREGDVKREVFENFAEDSTLRACGLSGCEALERHWTESFYPASTMIVSEEDEDDDVFFILSGRVRAATYTVSGKEVMLSDLRSGEGFGQLAAIDGRPRSTNIVALEDSRIARITAAHFNEVLETNRDVLRAHLLHLVELVRSLSARVVGVTALSARQRLIGELLRLARPQPGSPDVGIVDPLPTQQQLASAIFGQREAVGRDMSKLKEAGLIRRSRRTLEITSLKALRSCLDD